MGRLVAILDSGGRYVERVDESKAEELARRGVGVMEGRGRKRTVRLLHHHREDFELKAGREDARPVYLERISGIETVALKRIDGAGGMRRWAPGLTFDDLRAGRMRPSKRRISECLLEAEAA
jgi:hypothetical protein